MTTVVLLLIIIGIVVFFILPTTDGVKAHEVVVSLAIDASNVEIQYEAFRLLTSLQLNGGTLSTSRVAVCISYEGEDEATIDPQLLASLQQFNLWSVIYSKRYSLPEWSPSLNKLCALDPPGVQEDDYLLYLDADIFVISDPLIPLTKYARRADVVCGRPWNTFTGLVLEDFFDFVGVPSMFDDARYAMLESYAGGRTMYGMCNSGMYFMPALVAKAMVTAARVYLTRAAITPKFRHTEAYAPSNFGIDSIILWAAQYSLNYTVAITSTTLNFMAPTERFIPRFLQLDRENALSEAEALARGVGAADPSSLADVELPILAHFSRGSDLYIFYSESEQTATTAATATAEIAAASAPMQTASDAALIDAGDTVQSNIAAQEKQPAGAVVDQMGNAMPTPAPTVSSPSVPSPSPTASDDPAAPVCVVIMRGHMPEYMGLSLLMPLAYGLFSNDTACRIYADALMPYAAAMKLTPVRVPSAEDGGAQAAGATAAAQEQYKHQQQQQ